MGYDEALKGEKLEEASSSFPSRLGAWKSHELSEVLGRNGTDTF